MGSATTSIGTPHIAAISARSQKGKRMKRSRLLTRAAALEKGGQILQARRSPACRKAGRLGDAPPLDAGRTQLRQDHLAAIDLFGDARGADDGDDVVMGQVPAAGRAPHVDATAVGDQQPRVVPAQGVAQATHREREVARDQHGRLSPRLADAQQPGLRAVRKHAQHRVAQVRG